MGEFYGSTQVRTGERERVVAGADAVATRLGIRCLVGAALGEWVGVYPEGQGQDDKVGAALAKELGGVVMHVMVHDGDVLAYWLWEDGELVDSYWSLPGYFGEEDQAEQEKRRGDAGKVAALCGVDAGAIERLLHAERGMRATERLERLGKLLKMKNLSSAYEYMKEDDGGGVTGYRKFLEVPAKAADAAKEVRRRARAAVASRKKALKAEGLLLGEVPMEMHSPCAALLDGFLVITVKLARHGEANQLEVVRCREPWKAEKLAWELDGFVRRAASDASGRKVWLVQNERSVVIDAESGEILEVVTEPDPRAHCSVVMQGIFEKGRRGPLPFEMKPREVLVENGRWMVVCESGGEVRIYQAGVEGVRKAFYPGGRMSGPLSLVSGLEGLDAGRRARVEKALAGYAAAMLRLREELGKGNEEPARSRERVSWIGLSRDELSFWTVGDMGMKVYDFWSVVSSEEEPREVWGFAPDGPLVGVEEAGSGTLLMAGFDGSLPKLWAGELSCGKWRELVTLPEGGVSGLLVSRDKRFLGVRTHPVEGRGRGALQIWSLERLLAKMGPRWGGGEV